MENQYLVIKIGGRPAASQDLLDTLLQDLLVARRQGFWPVLVHGGGAAVSEFSRRLGIEPIFQDGKRLTGPAEMDIVDAILGGLVNTRLLRRALAAGLSAVGLSGVDAGLFLAAAVQPNTNNRTGQINQTNPQIITVLASQGIVPIVSSLSADSAGLGLNINADDAALAIAQSLAARALIFLSDTVGVLKNGRLMPQLTPSTVETEIGAGVISGGMIPKIRGAAAALDSGIGRVAIGNYEQAGDLARLLEGTRGTVLTKEYE